jgi:hypothetical protein
LPLAESLPLALAFATLVLAVRLSVLEYLDRKHRRSRKMAKFEASKVVDPLEYDLRPHYDKFGTIKEPNDRQIADYMSGTKEIVKELQGKLPKEIQNPDADLSEMLSAVDDLDPEVVMTFHQKMAGVVAQLCSGDPSKDDILAIPIRIRVIFYGWLQQEVMSPEAAPGGGSNVTTLPARAG